MASLNESEKKSFAEWMLSILNANKETISSAKPGVKFDAGGYASLIEAKNKAIHKADGMLGKLEADKREQTKNKNIILDDLYNAASDLADAIVGHIGKKHKLSVIIRNKRDSMNRESSAPEAAAPDSAE